MRQVLSPSDLLHFSGSGLVLVGGRIVLVDAGHLVLADALGTLLVSLTEVVALSPGDLTTLEVVLRDGRFHFVSLVTYSRCPEPRGDGEFSRLQTGQRGRLLEARSRALRVVRAYFEEEGFIEVETPAFVPSPGLDPHVHSLASISRGPRTDYLITSPEFHMKRLLVGGMPRIYQIARCFRAEEEGALHEPEFSLLEWYRAFAPWESMLADTEELVCRVVKELQPSPDAQFTRPFDRLTVREAFAQYGGVADAVELAALNPPAFFETLVDHVEPGLSQRTRPTFLTHYPLSLAALARPDPSDPTVAERFELYVGQVELSNGYGELTRAEAQRERFEAELARRARTGEPQYPIDERLLDALVEGMPEAAGNALGLDRLIALALGESAIKNALAFSDAER